MSSPRKIMSCTQYPPLLNNSTEFEVPIRSSTHYYFFLYDLTVPFGITKPPQAPFVSLLAKYVNRSIINDNHFLVINI